MNCHKLPQCEQDWKNLFVTNQSFKVTLRWNKWFCYKFSFFHRLAISDLRHIFGLSGWRVGKDGTTWLIKKLMKNIWWSVVFKQTVHLSKNRWVCANVWFRKLSTLLWVSMKSTRNLNTATNYTKLWVYKLIEGRNCSNYNHFQPRHLPIISVQCVNIFCRGNYIYISSQHTFLIEISVFGFVGPLDCLNTILIYNNIIIMLHFVSFVICPIVITSYVT